MITKLSALIDRFLPQVRPYNVDRENSLRGLDPNDIDQLVTIRGMVIRATALVPEMSEAFFRCAKCNHEEKVEIEKGRINEPAICRLCQVSFYQPFFIL